MPKLAELTSAKHGNFKVEKNAVLQVVKNQHTIGLRINEVCNASSNFPIFFTRMQNSQDWAISAVTSLEIGNNLFVHNNEWNASYVPSTMRTYPLYLIKKDGDENQYTVGIDEESAGLSTTEGDALFEQNGKASLYLANITKILESDLNNIVHTFKFNEKIESLGLMKAMDVVVQYADGQENTITGLLTISEDKLQDLDASQFEELRKLGYLAPIYAMLISLYQLNSLIRHQNIKEGSRKIHQIKMEVAKEKF